MCVCIYIMRWIESLVLLAAAVVALPSPGQLFNLSDYILQLPVGPQGNTMTVKNLSTYSSEYFYTATDSSIAMWAPVTGNTSSGSLYPRTELRDVSFNQNGVGDWTLNGTHKLNVTMTVMQVPQVPKITIGQLHSNLIGSSSLYGSCSVLVELEWQSGTLVNYMRKAPTLTNPNCAAIITVLPGYYPLGQPFSYSIQVVNTTVTVSTSQGDNPSHTYSWWNTSGSNIYWAHFKVGTYVQDNNKTEGSLSGGLIKVSKLYVSHAS
jgi:hypothetical protein